MNRTGWAGSWASDVVPSKDGTFIKQKGRVKSPEDPGRGPAPGRSLLAFNTRQTAWIVSARSNVYVLFAILCWEPFGCNYFGGVPSLLHTYMCPCICIPVYPCYSQWIRTRGLACKRQTAENKPSPGVTCSLALFVL